MSGTLSGTRRIVVVDDHGIVRFGYSQLISQEPKLEVCRMAATEQEGFEAIRDEQPELAIIDLSLKEGDGLDLVKSVAAHVPNTKMLVISAHDENLYANRVLAAGAMGYINKREAPEKLIDGILTILGGDFFFSEVVTKNLIRTRQGRSISQQVEGIDSLSNRELQVFERIGQGHCTREIADEMYLSVKTIERYKENIKHKLDLGNATQLVQHATEWILKRNY